MNVAAVLLAAGASRRLGQSKQTVVLGGETLLRRAVQVAQQAKLLPILVIVRDRSMGAGLSGCQIVVNQVAEEGIASSIRCGVEQARVQGVEGAVLMSCDQIALRPEHLHQLCAQVDRVTGSQYDGKIGIPAYFPASSFGALLQLTGDVGARDLLREAAFVTEEALKMDVDTEVDLENARVWLETGA